MNNLISVVIPVYNGSQYIGKTLESLLHSTYHDIEIICVDDFSTDDSVSIILKYAEQDNRIRLLRMEKKGGEAVQGVNFALPYCTGDWFFYMSQDDLLSEDCLEKCMAAAQKHGADAALPDMIWYYEGGENNTGLFPRRSADAGGLLSSEDAFAGIISYRYPGSALKRTSIVRNNVFESHYFDSIDASAAKHVFLANKVATCDGRFYYRQDNPGAITKGQFSEYKISMVYTQIELLEYAVKHSCSKATLKEISDSYLRRIKAVYKHAALDLLNKPNVAEDLKKSLCQFKAIAIKNGLWLKWVKSFSINKAARRRGIKL